MYNFTSVKLNNQYLVVSGGLAREQFDSGRFSSLLGVIEKFKILNKFWIMGLFNEKFKSTVVSYLPRNEQEAWIAIMHACIAVDEVVADEELEELSETLANNSFFEDHDVREYYRSVLLAHAKIGSKHLIDTSVDAVAAENKATLFARTIELVLADKVLADKEEELIRYLFSALDLEETIARKIVKEILDQHKDQVDM